MVVVYNGKTSFMWQVAYYLDNGFGHMPSASCSNNNYKIKIMSFLKRLAY